MEVNKFVLIISLNNTHGQLFLDNVEQGHSLQHSQLHHRPGNCLPERKHISPQLFPLLWAIAKQQQQSNKTKSKNKQTNKPPNHYFYSVIPFPTFFCFQSQFLSITITNTSKPDFLPFPDAAVTFL